MNAYKIGRIILIFSIPTMLVFGFFWKHHFFNVKIQKSNQAQEYGPTNWNLPFDYHVTFPHSVDILVRVADTEQEREIGLSGISKMNQNEGMLFIFPQMGIYPFWMKDMQFPLDIIWIDDEMRIIDIHENIYPESYPKTFISRSPARYVLEMNAGSVLQNGFSLGQIVIIKNNTSPRL